MKNNEANISRKYVEAIYEKLRKMFIVMENNDAVKTVKIEEGKVHIYFSEKVDIEGQDIINVFRRGGAIKKTESKDNIEDQYFEIPANGEF